MAVIAMTVILFLLHRIMGLREVTYLMTLFMGWIIVAIACAIGIALVARPRISRMFCDIATPYVGDKLRVSAEIETTLPWTTFIRVLWAAGQHAPTYATNHHLSGRRGLITIPIKARRRGLLEVEIRHIAWSDPFSLFSFRRKLRGATSILILPTPLNPGKEARPAGAPRSRSIPIDEGEAAGAIREYRNGDAPRSIHWKQSARQGRLLVNVPEVPAPQVATLVLDTRETSWTINSDQREGSAAKSRPIIDWAAFERAIRVCAFYIEEWLENGEDIELHVGDRVLDSSELGGDALICELAQVNIESREEYQNWRPDDGGRLSTLVGSPRSAELCEYLAPEGSFICSDLDVNDGAANTPLGDSNAVVTPSGWTLVRVGPDTGATAGYAQGPALGDFDDGQENYGFDAYDAELEASGPLVAVPGSHLPRFYPKYAPIPGMPIHPAASLFDQVSPSEAYSSPQTSAHTPAPPAPTRPRNSHYGATYSPSSTAAPDVPHSPGVPHGPRMPHSPGMPHPPSSGNPPYFRGRQ